MKKINVSVGTVVEIYGFDSVTCEDVTVSIIDGNVTDIVVTDRQGEEETAVCSDFFTTQKAVDLYIPLYLLPIVHLYTDGKYE